MSDEPIQRAADVLRDVGVVAPLDAAKNLHRAGLLSTTTNPTRDVFLGAIQAGEVEWEDRGGELVKLMMDALDARGLLPPAAEPRKVRDLPFASRRPCRGVTRSESSHPTADGGEMCFVYVSTDGDSDTVTLYSLDADAPEVSPVGCREDAR